METQKQLSVRRGILISAIFLGVMAAISVWAYWYLPAGQNYPTHWGLSGQPDGYGSKLVLALAMPFSAAALAALLAFIPLIEPRLNNLRQSGKAYLAIWISALALLTVMHAAMVAAAVGFHVPMTTLTGIGMGLLFVVIGNYMGKLRSNYFAGIRTPWTLSSELSWNKTHRLGGKLFMLYGVAIAIAALGSPVGMLTVLLAGLAILCAITLPYSWYVWKLDKGSQQNV